MGGKQKTITKKKIMSMLKMNLEFFNDALILFICEIAQDNPNCFTSINN